MKSFQNKCCSQPQLLYVTSLTSHYYLYTNFSPRVKLLLLMHVDVKVINRNMLNILISSPSVITCLYLLLTNVAATTFLSLWDQSWGHSLVSVEWMGLMSHFIYHLVQNRDQCPLMGLSEHSNEPLSSIKDRLFFDLFSSCLVLSKDSASWCYCSFIHYWLWWQK